MVRRHGIDVTVVAPHAAGAASQEILNGVRVRRFRYAMPATLERLAYGSGVPDNLRSSWLARLQVPSFLLSMLYVLAEEARRCEILHVHWPEAAFAGAVVKRLLGLPMVVTVHSISLSAVRRVVHRAALGAADCVLYPGRYTERFARKGGLANRGKILPLGVDVSRFAQAKNRNTWRRKYGIAQEAPVVLGLGRLIKLKGFSFLIEGFAAVHEALPEARLLVAGDGPEANALQRRTRELGLEGVVHFPGAVASADVPDLLAEADLFVTPSAFDEEGRTEALGLVTIEAMAAGLACVGTRVGGIPEVIVDGETGVLVPPADPGALALAVLRLLRDSDERTRMGRAGQERAERLFRLETYVDRVVDVYKDLLESRRSS